MQDFAKPVCVFREGGWTNMVVKVTRHTCVSS